MAGERWLRIRLAREGWRTVDLYAGPWAIRAGWPNGGRYGNGSRWHSGWYRWADRPDC